MEMRQIKVVARNGVIEISQGGNDGGVSLISITPDQALVVAEWIAICAESLNGNCFRNG